MRSDDTTIPPATQSPRAALEAWQRNEKPKLDRDRYAILAVLSSILAVALAGVIFLLLPLKTVAPYIIETDATGRTEVVGAAQEKFDPTEAQIIYFISRWTESLWSLDRALIKNNLESAYGMTRGKGSDVFRQFVRANKPIERSTSDPSLTAVVQIKTINFIGDHTALARFVVTERSKEIPPRTDTYMMTLHWAIQPPKTAAQIMKNPIGFFVTDFSWSKEVNANEK
ncbi:MAG: type IV secretion system protein [Candidatus Thiodiazotropha lotti]|nr:type IV secretion system protein [Candidatus Thiodiazotropha lotti]